MARKKMSREEKRNSREAANQQNYYQEISPQQFYRQQGNAGGQQMNYQQGNGGQQMNYQQENGGQQMNYQQGNGAGQQMNYQQGNAGGQQMNYQQGNAGGQQMNYQQGNGGGQQMNYQQGNGGQQMNYQQGNGGQQMNYRQAPNYNYGGQPPYYQQPYPGGQGNVPNKKKKKRKTRKIVLFVIEVLLLVILAAALYVGAQISKLSQIQNVNTEEQNAIQSNISQQLDDAVEETLKGYWNIALYGIDSREGSTESGLSDTIMICSINRSTKEVKLVSVYRDTYLDNTNGDYRKATECYILGGPSRSINMLNKNFDLDIVNYVTVNMNIVAEVVDSVGGVDIDVRQEEIEWINGYQNETSTITNREIVPVTSAGMQTLNGIQATSYCRIRQIGLDYERTERQRKVLMAILEKVKKNPTLLLSIIDDVLPYVSTNLTKTQILDLATDVASYNLTDTTGFPFEKEAITMDNDIVVPVNLAQNVAELHQYLFGSDGYTPSATVQEISNTIANVTGVY